MRAYANKNPKQEYKREAFELFEALLERLKQEVVRILSHLQIKRQDEAELIEQKRREEAERQQLAFQHAQASALPEAEQEVRPAGGGATATDGARYAQGGPQ